MIDVNFCVSIVIPTHNRAKFIGHAIDSCLLACSERLRVQTIIVDDGSRDNTQVLLKDYDDRIQNIVLPTNRGRNYARNQGLDASTGNYVKFLDSDDQLCPGALAKEVELAEKHCADIVISATQEARILGNGRLNYADIPLLLPPLIQSTVDDILAGKAVPTSAALYRREFVRELRWDENLSKLDDWDWFIRACLLNAKIVKTDEPSYFWCTHEEQGIRKTSQLQNALEHHIILDKLRSFLLENQMLTKPRANRLAQYYYKELRFLCLHDEEKFIEAIRKIKLLDPNFYPRDEERQSWMRVLGRVIGFSNAIRTHTKIKKIWQSISSSK